MFGGKFFTKSFKFLNIENVGKTLPVRDRWTIVQTGISALIPKYCKSSKNIFYSDFSILTNTKLKSQKISGGIETVVETCMTVRVFKFWQSSKKIFLLYRLSNFKEKVEKTVHFWDHGNQSRTLKFSFCYENLDILLEKCFSPEIFKF